MYWLSDRFIIFVLLANSYWVPQIVRNAYHNHRQALKPWYVVTTSFMRYIGAAVRARVSVQLSEDTAELLSLRGDGRVDDGADGDAARAVLHQS